MRGMRPCFQIEIETPKKFLLNGLWFGPKKPQRVIVWVHGLGSSMFSKLRIIDQCINAETAVVTFNNNGHDTISHRVRIDGKKGAWAGAAHEKFTDCIDDIQGAINFLRSQKVKSIYLAGHSTGCQKSIYWASKSKDTRNVKGIMLLAPVSDYAAAVKKYGKKKLAGVESVARSLIRRGKPHALLPKDTWPEELNDAQRFLSLYTPDSIEEIFSYAQSEKNPVTLKKVKIPILALWAESDEFSDRPAIEAAQWFEKNIKSKHKVVIVPGVTHGFRGGEKIVAKEIRQWIEATK